MNDQPQSRELAVAKQIAGHLQKMETEYRAVLPAHITPEAFTRVAQTAIQMNEDLQQCSQRSLIAACTRLAEMGLVPDGKEAALVVFNVKVKRKNPNTGLMEERYEKRATPMPMVEGLRDLVRRSGQVKNWKARIVRRGDVFRHIDGDEESLVHEPMHDFDQPITHVYSIAYLENGELARHVMPIAAVEKIRKRSKNADSGPWANDYDQMVLKTCMKQQAKYLPKAKDDLNRARFMGAMRAIDEADEAEALPSYREPVPQLSVQQASRDRLARAIEAQVFEDEQDEDAAEADRLIQRGRELIADRESAEKVQAPAQAAPRAPRKRRTADERLAEANAPKQPKQPPAAAAGGLEERHDGSPEARAFAQAVPSATDVKYHPGNKAASTAAHVEEGRDLDYERQAAQQQMDAASADDDRFPGDIPSGEADGEEPEVLAYRDGWHTRALGKPRIPPTTINSAVEAECWFKGWDAYKMAVDLGNAPQNQAASDAMLDRMVGQVFV